jgi:predicted nucleic acid-binding protein
VVRVIVRDAGPLWLAVSAVGKPPADACRAWLKALDASGARVVVPEVADYEVRRELLLRNAKNGLARLDAFATSPAYLPVTTDAMRRAAGFWAALRRVGQPTAAPDSLDADAVLAGQVETAGRPGDAVTVATTNVRHLALFGLDARDWQTIA